MDHLVIGDPAIPTSRTAKVRCTFENTDQLLKPEMYATVEISVNQKKVLAIPRSALLRLGEYQVVFLQVGAAGGYVRFARIPVDVDATQSRPWAEVKHGLEPGQQVVTSGAELLSQKL